MPIQTNFLERTAFFSLNMAPSPVLDLAGMFAFQVLSVAIRQGVFRALDNQPLTASALAQQLNTQERGTGMLLEALAAIGYLREDNGRYKNTPLTEKWILDTEAFNLQAMVEFWSAAALEWNPHAGDVLRSGERPYDFYEWVANRPELYRAYQQQLMTAAVNEGQHIAQKVELPDGATRLLDVGGAHGMFSIIFCQTYPQLQATILDNHAGVKMARENIADRQMTDRIHILEGDLWQAEWGDGYDIILLFNLIHHFGAELNVKLLQRCAEALRPGGRVAILDQIAGKVSGKATNALIRLIAWQYYLFADGRVHEHDDIDGWLTQAGFGDIRSIKLPRQPGNSLMFATRQ